MTTTILVVAFLCMLFHEPDMSWVYDDREAAP
jgi:hypothetical protein